MKIKKIELDNFRQFIGKHELLFSIDDNKSVTFIMAENMSGKTTIIEAFRFLFFGYTEGLGDEGPINLSLYQNANAGKEIEIKVVAEIEYKNTDYTILRKQLYKKSEKKLNQTVNMLKITYKDENGVTKSLGESNAKDFIREIMPENLFDYFFFEGEEIEKLGESLFAKNKKQNAFAEAIKNLLGFTYLYKLKDNLQKVVKKFNDDLEIAYANDEENKKLQEKINESINAKTKYEEEIKHNNDELEKLQEEKEKVSKILLENATTKEKQKERAQIKKEIDDIEIKIKQTKQRLFSNFSKNGWYLFASKLKDKAIETLESEGQIDKGIPGLDASCVKYIIEHHKCICGAEVVEGTSAYNRLKELENFIPPISVGTQIREFKEKIENTSKSSTLVYDAVKTGKSELNDLISNYEKKEKQIEELDKVLSNSKDMSKYVEEQQKIENDIIKLSSAISVAKEKINEYENIISENEKAKKGVKTNERANFIEKCLYYNKRSYNVVEEHIEKHEKEMKEDLENKINKKKKKVFNVGYNIELLDDLTLEMHLKNENITNVAKMSGAQDTIIAFAFIGAVIELSKKKIVELKKKKDSKEKQLQNNSADFDDNAEPYPLVLDAPSSNFDIKRIKEFCNFIPSLAEQTIILIKDTDGNYVESELKNKIGKRYKLNKISDWETNIVEE